MDARHHLQTTAQGLHSVVAFEFADAAARAAGTVATPSGYSITSVDIGKVGKQLDNNTHYILVSVGPLSWNQIDASTGGFVAASRQIIAGAGLTGGGDLSADRTLNVVANADGSIVVDADDVQVGVLATDAQHGNRGGGGLHPAATGAVAGFQSAADKTKLDGVRAAATSALLHFGNTSVASSTTTRYLAPGYAVSLAPTVVVQYRVPFSGTLKNLRIVHNGPAGNGNPIVYTLRVNAVAQALQVSLFSTASSGVDSTHSVVVAAGDLIDIEVTKAAGVGSSPSDVMASLEMAS